METPSKKTRVLFVCEDGSYLGPMAEAFLRAETDDATKVTSAGVGPGHLDPGAVEVMRELDLDLNSHQQITVADLGPQTFDLLISLCDLSHDTCVNPLPQSNSLDQDLNEYAERSALFVGAPMHLHWSISESPAPNSSRDLSFLRKIRNQIHSRVHTLIQDGYLAAMKMQRQRLEQILDAMDDGIVVHDHQRNIFLFNRAAERITGYQRDEVLGANCHEVFAPDGLCGSNCMIDAGPGGPACTDGCKIAFRTKEGEDRRLSMNYGPAQMPEPSPPGVIATFRDITEVSRLRRKVKEKQSFHGMVGVSAAMKDVFRTIRQVTTSDYPVLITGDSGTGKELVANAIHNESRRSAGAFVPINCGALPENILESELFGHVRGAFTGAIRDKKGRFELAHRGTIFLDEVGELSTAFQVKLLRVLEEKQFEAVGGEKTISVDVRVISATNRDLRQLIKDGAFRDDLFYRLSVVPIHLPPLRDRTEDLPLLVKKIMDNIQQETSKTQLALDDEVMDLLLGYQWPGNIRELINVLQFASVRGDGERIQVRHLPPEVRSQRGASAYPAAHNFAHPRRNKLTEEMVQDALSQSGGNKVRAAQALGVGRATLYRFLAKHPVS